MLTTAKAACPYQPSPEKTEGTDEEELGSTTSTLGMGSTNVAAGAKVSEVGGTDVVGCKETFRTSSHKLSSLRDPHSGSAGTCEGGALEVDEPVPSTCHDGHVAPYPSLTWLLHLEVPSAPCTTELHLSWVLC